MIMGQVGYEGCLDCWKLKENNGVFQEVSINKTDG
jgi:hypothetical protein